MQLTQKKKILLSIVLISLFLLGTGLTAYPFVSAWYSERVRSEIRAEYEGALDDPQSKDQLKVMKESAIAYNHKLYSGVISPLEPEENGYYDQLKFEDSSIMCYIRIPKIDVELPVYHGISEAELRAGAGHMPQTSLPVGGENTHAVIAAHSGMASSPMFTDIGLLEEGDLVYIDSLDETLTYQVYGPPEEVLPGSTDSIRIQEGEDLLTLVTCWPVNVNTHRLLVHCRRAEPSDGTSTSDAKPLAETISGTEASEPAARA